MRGKHEGASRIRREIMQPRHPARIAWKRVKMQMRHGGMAAHTRRNDIVLAVCQGVQCNLSQERPIGP
jgi:hypothetical protein